MKKKVDDQNILLVKEGASDELKVVSGVSKDGDPESVEAKPENEPQFLKINLQSNALDNFITNYISQFRNPTHFYFFKSPLGKMYEVIKTLRNAFSKPEEPSSKAAIETFKVSGIQPENNHTIDESRIDWSQLERIGVNRELLVRTKNLDAMLSYHKSPSLIPITLKFEGITLRTDARLSFREAANGSITLNIHAIRKNPQLDHPYYGIKFTDEDKQNLLSTGNLGRKANAEFRQGEPTPVFISLDRKTNELVAIQADKLKIPDTIKGVSLTEVQKKELSEGKSIAVEGMISKNGKEFSSHIQINAEKRGIEFLFDSPINQSKQKEQSTPLSKGEVRIPKTLLGAGISEKQQKQLQEGQTIYVAGMRDSKGQEFNAYVKVNSEKCKLDFFRWNPDKAKSKEVTPDNASKTQVAVNNEGKSNEGLKRIDEPIKKGQAQPTEKQSEKQDKKEAKGNKQTSEKPKKSKGVSL